MALEMRPECERCRQPLAHEDIAFVCSLECTYCPACAEVLGAVCDHCAGELVRRPRRIAARLRAGGELGLAVSPVWSADARPGAEA